MRLTSIFLIAVTIAATAFGGIQNARVVSHPVGVALAETINSIRSSAGSDAWIAYEVPTPDSRSLMCCWDHWNDDSDSHQSKKCSLSGGATSFINRDGSKDLPQIDTSTMIVVLRYSGSSADEVLLYSGGCAVDAGGRTIHRIEGVSLDQSLNLLNGIVSAKNGRRGTKRALSAIAMHDSPRAVEILERLALGSDDEMRGDAIFWLAQVGGRRGFDVARKIATADPSDSVRKKAVFALTQSGEPGVVDALTSIVRTHPDADTRSEAVFWLGQHAGVKALPILRERLEKETDTEVIEKAIFAIGQVPGEEAAQMLITLAREGKSSHVRKQALFWLGQKAEKRVAKVLTESLDDPESEVREMAVFAISQRPKEEAIPALIELARSHRDPDVRKKAIFWLSQMDDPRAVAAIEKIVLR